MDGLEELTQVTGAPFLSSQLQPLRENTAASLGASGKHSFDTTAL